MYIKVLVTGGTLLQRSVQGTMQIEDTISESLSSLPGYAQHHYSVELISLKNGADLDFNTVFNLKKAIEATDQTHGILIISGTDSLEEMAFLLDLVMDPRRNIVVTGAMKPKDTLGYDGLANLDQAIMVLTSLV